MEQNKLKRKNLLKKVNNIFECKYMKHIFELRMKDQIDQIEERSLQLLRNLSSCEKKA